eukprot:scaffold44312_cov37-Tisochrysis_lutea.AAC.1
MAERDVEMAGGQAEVVGSALPAGRPRPRPRPRPRMSTAALRRATSACRAHIALAQLRPCGDAAADCASSAVASLGSSEVRMTAACDHATETGRPRGRECDVSRAARAAGILLLAP